MRCAGTVKILRYNWPWYAFALLLMGGVGIATAAGLVPHPWKGASIVVLALTLLWGLLSLAVSYVVYDASDVARGEWLGAVSAGPIAVFHFGEDEATALVARRLPGAVPRSFDLYDPVHVGSPSLRRARSLAGLDDPRAPIALDHLPLEDGSVALGILAFAAHEIRTEDARVALFSELARILTSSGRLVVLEHLRDPWNFFAFGPGAFHFRSRGTWLRTFAGAGLEIARESRITLWVRRFELRRSA